MKKLSVFAQAYIEAALWSECDDDGTPLDKNYSISDIAPDTLEELIADCDLFQKLNAKLLQTLDDAQCGHDLWLTRNGHGAGFWDRGYPKGLGEALTESCNILGPRNLYVGDDGQLHI